MNTKDFYYDLPKELIAQTPLQNRSDSKLLILDRTTKEIQHKNFYNIIDELNANDCLVLNDTKVIPARLIGEKAETRGAVEVLLLNRYGLNNEEKLTPLSNLTSGCENIWECLVKPGKKARIGQEIIFGNGILVGEVIDILEDGNRLILFKHDGIFEEVLDVLGTMPLPPYISYKLDNKSRYQTIYAKYEGSAAAPTAGLHFTEELLKKITQKGVKIAFVTLHVGLGTFRPVKVENINEHVMHTEYYNVDNNATNIINDVKRNGGRIIAVGTTSCRTLESATIDGELKAGCGNTDIFIYPGYEFKMVDALITNFHLPESTLMMLISALANKDLILNTYNIAIQNKYRFFSFGDAMFIK